MAVFEESLCVGGIFHVSPAGDSHLARWGGCKSGPGVPYCFGDGSGSACPCGNAGGPGSGCANSAGPGASLGASGSADLLLDDLALTASGLVPSAPALLFAASSASAGSPFGDGLLCAEGGTVWHGRVRFSDASGRAAWGPGIASQGSFAPGQTARFQILYRDATGSPCGSGFNLSNGLEVTFF